MKPILFTIAPRLAVGLALLVSCATLPATERYVSLTGGHVAPFLSWDMAATNIQAAIDAASDGDWIWVTNGFYATGGRVLLANTLTNRVVMDKALTVSSVNGPTVTAIVGQWGLAAGPGTRAIRCAWLTNNATLIGFTLRDGATSTAGATEHLSGGGVWCASTSARLIQCILIGNAALGSGGGCYSGTLKNCIVTQNKTVVGWGSGTAYSTLINCTVVTNSTSPACYGGAITNCIAWGNGSQDLSGVAVAYSCTTPPKQTGPGNIAVNPQLSVDGAHLAATSPCRGAGNAVYATGTDIDGQAWASPPSMGADEWRPEPVIVRQPQAQFAVAGTGFRVSVLVAGQEPFTCWWTRDGVPVEDDAMYSGAHTTNLVATGTTLIEGSSFQVTVSNASGVVTSAVAQLPFHYVNLASTNSIWPFLTWDTAATTIQSAIDAASAGDLVLVTNGVYAVGGRMMVSDLMNRVALTKALAVRSLNGPAVSIIQCPGGTYNSGSGVRCAWLTNGAVLNGFTLIGGATRSSSDITLGCGGGVFATSTNAFLVNCIISSNSSPQAGGVFQGTLTNCTLTGNASGGFGGGGLSNLFLNCTLIANSAASGGGGGASYSTLAGCILMSNSCVNASGGGAQFSTLSNCLITSNSASQGGGVDQSTLANCSLFGNQATSAGGGAYRSTLNNCLLRSNRCSSSAGGAQLSTLNNCTLTANSSNPTFGGTGSGGSAGGTLNNCIAWGNTRFGTNADSAGDIVRYSCVLSLAAPGTGSISNISLNPQFLADGLHLDANSPCRGAGNSNYITGTDLFGNAWLNPPSMGCLEWVPQPLVVAPPNWQFAAAPGQATLAASVAGQPPFYCWWTHDGQPLESGPDYGNAHSVSLSVRVGPQTMGAYQVVASNSFGISTSAVVNLVVHCADAASSSPTPPFTNWLTAASTIQAAVDAAAPGDWIVVTNGIYASGGKVMAGDLTNRIALDKPVQVLSVNGADVTVIQGDWDPATTNGPGAVRCAWLTNGAGLFGFTLRGGATRSSGDWTSLMSGGGVWCVPDALVLQCQIVSNRAAVYGGGSCDGTIKSSTFLRNAAGLVGGGAWASRLLNCIVSSNYSAQSAGGIAGRATNCFFTGNSARLSGGGAENSLLHNCTVTGNWVESGSGGGVNSSLSGSSTLSNCILWGNKAATYPNCSIRGGYYFVCTSPLASGPGNISVDPQLVGGMHLAATSPCRGMGTNFTVGTDLDGEPWANPPSMGCDEVYEAALTGSLAVAIQPQWTEVPARVGQTFTGIVTGRAARLEWSFGDGPTVTNVGWLASHTWTNAGDYTVTLTAFNADNPVGVSASVVIHVVPVAPPLLSAGILASNVFQLTFPAQTNVTWVVESATNLAPPAAWQTVQTLTGTGSPVSLQFANATNDAKFYRLRQP